MLHITITLYSFPPGYSILRHLNEGYLLFVGKAILLDSFNIARIADLFQAEWMINPLLAYLKNHVAESHPAAIFKLGQHYHRVCLCEDAVSIATERGTTVMRDLWSCAVSSSKQDRLQCLSLLTKYTSLKQVTLLLVTPFG